MKIAYTISGIYNSGGMERILAQKVNYLADVKGYDVSIVTTDQKGRVPFFFLSKKVKLIDLRINYCDYNDKNLLYRLSARFYKSKVHKRRLLNFLRTEKHDVTVSLFDYDMGFLYKLKDGSKKVLEFHFSKYIKVLEAKNLFMRLIQRKRVESWGKIVGRYERFVVLTEEDKQQWGNLENICVIPNCIKDIPTAKADLINERVISVGRVSYQKGFDLLLQAWKKVTVHYPSWKLCIIGGGDKSQLCKLIHDLQIDDTVQLLPPTRHIQQEYLKSSLYVMSSRYEGLPMVLLEAMSCGLPIVSFACPCGPKDIIDNTFGSLVDNGDVTALANDMMLWMRDIDRRKRGGEQARKAVMKYNIETVMKSWIKLFEEVVDK